MSPNNNNEMKIVNLTKNTVLAENAIVANTVFKRIKGLLGKKEINIGQALILKPCNSIHTLFMRFPIDVVFVEKRNRVVKIISCLKPWRLSGIYLTARLCIELPVDTIRSNLTSAGDTLSFID